MSPLDRAIETSNRIHSGGTTAHYFSFYSTHKAGIFQQANVPANATVQFSMWGQAWVSNADEGGSDRGAPINMRVGIDPTGGTNPYSPSVVWSGIMQPYDAYQQFVVTAQAQGSEVTVFTYSAPSFPMKHNDVYWDDAALVVVGACAAPPPAQTPPPAAPLPPGEESPTGVTVTTTANLRLRAGPSTTYLFLATAPRGMNRPALGRNTTGDWIRVSYQGQTGWMAAWYLTVSGGTVDSLPVHSP